MKTNKENYLKQIRADTAYPTYRGIVGVITFLGYLLIVVYTLIGIVASLSGMRDNPAMGSVMLVGCILGAILGIVLVRFLKEVALMIADMVDSIIDANSGPRDFQDLG